LEISDCFASSGEMSNFCASIGFGIGIVGGIGGSAILLLLSNLFAFV
jgi:hypothetical protein